ncbi:MAG TPA: transcriptional repressor LexA [Candidatus Macondimonas sp.]|nr:transcriptional repressor LexA [Candidatus Macondimonas sp.]
MDALTPRQQQILDLIRHAIAQDGAPPTLSELARTLGFASVNAVRDQLQALQRKGQIELTPRTARGIRLKSQHRPGLPIVGRVAAGQPILAEEHLEGEAPIDPAWFKGKADYLLRVQGMSMRDAGILDGDLVAVQRHAATWNGRIVVARWNGEATVKRLRLHQTTAHLEPANPDYPTLIVDLAREELVIEGVVIGVIRTTIDPP